MTVRRVFWAAVSGGVWGLMFWLLTGTPVRADEANEPGATAVISQHARQLADEILELKEPENLEAAPPSLKEAVRGLSIREAVEVGEGIWSAGAESVVAWVSLAAEREKADALKLDELVRRVCRGLPMEEAFRRTVHGSVRMRELCGEALLTEIIGVTLQSVSDGNVLELRLKESELAYVAGLPGLLDLTVDCSTVTEAGLEPLKGRSRLRDVTFIRCPHLGDRALELVANLDLELLVFSACPRLGDAGVAHLAQCPKLRLLNLDSSGVTSASLPVIAGCQDLRELGLSKSRVREGLEQLKGLTYLKRLRLAGLGERLQPVPAEGLAMLSGFRDLEELDLLETAIMSVEVKTLPRLKSLVVGHRILEELVLVDLPALASLQIGPRWSESFQTVELRRLEIARLPRIDRLEVPGLRLEAAVGLARMEGMDQLVQLRLPRAEMTDGLAEAIGRLPRLGSLEIGGDVTGDQLRGVGQARTLTSLQIGGRLLKPTDYKSLAEVPVRNLTVVGGEVPSEWGPGNWPGLEVLELQSGRGEAIAIRGMLRLRALKISQCEFRGLEVDGCPVLDGVNVSRSRIWRLDVRNCAALKGVLAGDASWFSMVRLADLPELGRLVFQEYTTVRGMKLEGTPKLKSASFWLADVSVRVIEALAEQPGLEKLDLSMSGVGDEAGGVVGRLEDLKEVSLGEKWGLEAIVAVSKLPKLQRMTLTRGPETSWKESELRSKVSQGVSVTVFVVN